MKHGVQGESVTVEVDGTDRAVMRVRLNAGTIAAESLPTLFAPFKRITPAKTGERGLVFGLFIAQEIVHAYGGEIAVRTAHGGAAVFELTLPREVATARSESEGSR